MTTSSVCIAQPAVEPISLAEAKLHLRIDDNSSPSTNPEDALIAMWISAARRYAELFINKALALQTWDLYLDAFPEEDYIVIPHPPLQYLESMTYRDSAGSYQVVSFLDPSGNALLQTDEYAIDTSIQPGRLYLKSGMSWPAAITEAQSIVIRFVCGYGDPGDVPSEIRAAILLKLSDLYENRGDSEGQLVADTKDRAVKALLWTERIIPI